MLRLCWFVDLLLARRAAVSIAFVGTESACLGSVIAVCAHALGAVRVVLCAVNVISAREAIFVEHATTGMELTDN
jgi:hypothetical protein